MAQKTNKGLSQITKKVIHALHKGVVQHNRIVTTLDNASSRRHKCTGMERVFPFQHEHPQLYSASSSSSGKTHEVRYSQSSHTKLTNATHAKVHPGTYIPTDPRESQAFAMERLKQQSDDQSKRLARCETEYRQEGNEYHTMPIAFRERGVTADLASIGTDAFVTDRNGEEDEKSNDIIRILTQLPKHRDNAKRALYIGDSDTAELELGLMQEGLDDLEDEELYSLTSYVDHMIREYILHFVTDNETGAALAETMRKIWVMSLPEVVNAFETGMIETEDEAMSMANTGVQEHIVESEDAAESDFLPQAEFSWDLTQV